MGQHFLTDQSIAKAIVAALEPAEGGSADVLEIGPGMGVLSQYLLQREDIDLKMIEIDTESVEYLQKHFPDAADKVIYGDFLKLDIDHLFPAVSMSSAISRTISRRRYFSASSITRTAFRRLSA